MTVEQNRALTERRAEKATLREATMKALWDVAAQHDGQVPARAVRDAALALGCSERTVWRMVARAGKPTRVREPWAPTEDMFKRLVTLGSVVDLREQLLAEAGGDMDAVPSVRTMQRGFQQRYATVQVAWARNGWEAARAHMPTARILVRDLNEEWSVDDTLVPVWCVLPDGTVGKAWLQMFVEASTRLVLSAMFAPTPFTTEDTVQNFADAVKGRWAQVDGFHNSVFIGGKPQRVRSDRGAIFINNAMTKGLLGVSIDRVFSEEYTPQQNGKHERLHRTLKKRLKTLPGYDWTEWREGDPRKARVAPPAKALLLFEEVQQAVLAVISDYNHQHVHSAHKKTPLHAWAEAFLADPDSIDTVDPVALRAAMRQTKHVKLRRQRIRWDNRIYEVKPYAAGETPTEDILEQRRAWTDNAEGRDVMFKYLPTRTEAVSVYDEFGHYLGDAIWDEHQTPEEATEAARRRRYHRKVFRDTNEDLARAGAQAVAARREEALDHRPDEAATEPRNAAEYRANHANRPAKKAAGRRKASAAEQAVNRVEQNRRNAVAQAAERMRQARHAEGA